MFGSERETPMSAGGPIRLNGDMPLG